MQFAVEGFGSITELRTGRRWSAVALARAVRVRAALLRAHGVGRGDRVLIRQAGTGSFFADLFAAWQVGACAICVSPKLTANELEHVQNFMEPRVELAGDDDLQAEDALLDDAEIDDTNRLAPSLDDDALILLTSGTTGTPKGVVHSFRSLLARLALNRAIVGDEALRTTLCLLPVHFGHGLIGNCLTPLVAGHDLVIASDIGPSLFGDLHRIVDEHAVTFMSSVPTTWRMLDRFSRGSPRRALTRVHVGSAPLSAALWRSIIEWSGTDDVVNAYGLTETANWVAGASARTHQAVDGLVGHVWGGTAAVLRQDGRLAASGEGEVVLQVPTAMRGYFRRPELDAETWVDGWFRTRDLGHVAADGTIRLLGRLGEEINRGGLKIYPQDIEQLVDEHPQVAEACAFAIADEILGQSVGVALVFTESAGVALDEVKAWVAARLTKEKVPDRWFVLDAIPRTDRGKVRRSAVAEHCLRQHDPAKALAR